MSWLFSRKRWTWTPPARFLCAFPSCLTTPLPPTYGVCALFVRERLAAGPRLRSTTSRDGIGRVDPRSDMAVIAAGVHAEAGAIAARIREAAFVMVATTLPELVSATAREAGYPIPGRRPSSPELKDGSVLMLAQPLEITKEDADRTVSYTEFDGPIRSLLSLTL